MLCLILFAAAAIGHHFHAHSVSLGELCAYIHSLYLWVVSTSRYSYIVTADDCVVFSLDRPKWGMRTVVVVRYCYLTCRGGVYNVRSLRVAAVETVIMACIARHSSLTACNLLNMAYYPSLCAHKPWFPMIRVL